jgi:hypothetical protein
MKGRQITGTYCKKLFLKPKTSTRFLCSLFCQWKGRKGFSFIHFCSAYLCFEEALAFRSQFGEKQIMQYIHQLAVDGGMYLMLREGGRAEKA